MFVDSNNIEKRKRPIEFRGMRIYKTNSVSCSYDVIMSVTNKQRVLITCDN